MLCKTRRTLSNHFRLLPIIRKYALETKSATFLLSMSKAKEIPKSLFRDVLSHSLKHLKLVMSSSSYSSWAQSQHNQDMAQLLLHCRQLGLFNELHTLATNISSEAQQETLNHMQSSFLPFLSHLINGMNKSNDLDLALFQDLSRDIISCFLRKSSLPDKPTPSRDWSRSPCGCGCMICQQLDAFLQNPQRSIFEFRRRKQERSHLEDQLLRHGNHVGNRHGSLQMSTDTSGNPHGLIIRKTLNEYEINLGAWQNNRNLIHHTITRLGLENLKKLLDRDFHTMVDELKPVPLSSRKAPINPQFVDLTADDDDDSPPSSPGFKEISSSSVNAGASASSAPEFGVVTPLSNSMMGQAHGSRPLDAVKVLANYALPPIGTAPLTRSHASQSLKRKNVTMDSYGVENNTLGSLFGVLGNKRPRLENLPQLSDLTSSANNVPVPLPSIFKILSSTAPSAPMAGDSVI